jgi:hypothetical protein
MAINPKFLTNANSILRLRAKGLYDTFVDIKQFQADNRTTAGARTVGQAKMGVDGYGSFGYVANLQDFNVYLEANSESVEVMQNILRYLDDNREMLVIEFEQYYPSVGRRANFSGGMISGDAMTGGGKELNGLQYTFSVDRVVESEV